MTRRLAPLLILALVLPYFHSIQADLYVNPDYIQLHAWVGDPTEAIVNVTAIGGNLTLSFTCESPIIAPENGTEVQDGETLPIHFQINTTTEFYGFRTCFIVTNDSSYAVTFELNIENPPEEGRLTLSSSSLTFSQEVGKVEQYPTSLYITNGYKWDAKIYPTSAPLWISIENLTLLPGETKPLPITVDTNGLIPGARYGGIVRFAYEVAGFTFEGSFNVNLIVNATETPPPENKSAYDLIFGLLDSSTAKPIQGATIIISWDGGALMGFTNATGYAEFKALRPQVYSYKVLMQGYEQEEGSVVLDRDRTVLLILTPSNESVNLSLQTQTETETQAHPTLRPGILQITAYSANMTIPRGEHDSVSIPLIASGGYVNISLQSVSEQPSWISASLTADHLLEGQTAFLIIEANPPNGTALGNYSKAFYLAYNGNIAQITANVKVVEANPLKRPRNSSYAILAVNGSGSIDGSSGGSVYRPASLQVPLVSVLLRGNEGITAEKPVQVIANDIVYVLIQGDPNHVRIVPKGLALLGAEPRADGILYKYQVKENGAQLDIRLVYYSPLTGEETYERPSEFGYGIYRFDVIAKEKPTIGEKNAILFVRARDGRDTFKTDEDAYFDSWIAWGNGSRTNYEGSITFSCKYTYRKNASLTPIVTFQAGSAHYQFRYAGTCIPQKPKSWQGDFQVSPVKVTIEPISVEKEFPKKLSDDTEARYDLSQLNMDIYEIKSEPRVHLEIRGSYLIFKPQAGVSYTFYIYGYSREKNADMVVKLYTDVVEASVASAAVGTAQTVIAIAIVGFLAWMSYNWLQARRRKRPWE